MKNILVISAHPDDEVLGCSGYICKQNSLGNKVFVLYLSEGVSSRFTDCNMTKELKKEINKRKTMAINVSKVLKFQIIDFFDLPNLRMENMYLLDLVKKIMSVIQKIRPSVILTHHPGDLNTDHKVAFEASFTALRPFSYDFKIEKLLTYEVPSSTNWSNSKIGPLFSPNFYLDISKFLDAKKKAFEIYKYEMRKFPHPRSWKSISAHHLNRGSEVGLDFAEAFEIIRELD